MKDITPPKKRPLKKPAVTTKAATAKTVVKKALKKPEKASPPKKKVVRAAAKSKEEPTPPLPDSIEIYEARMKELSLAPEKSRLRLIGKLVGTILLLLVIVFSVGAFLWYQDQQRPVDALNTSDVRVVIEQGMTPESIGERLSENGLIKSPLGFEWYLRVTRAGNNLQAGVYSLSQSMSLPEIVDRLRSGKTDTFRITFLPGATIADDQKVLINAGFSKESVKVAFAKHYDHTILKSKPASADLEGYIYGETYEFPSNATVEEILTRTFDELEKVIATHNLQAAYQKHGLTLYEGITLASIVQRETVGSRDQKMVAGVFYNRLEKKMNLGSDVTYQYIADKTGQERDPSLDSPYNTRRYGGLPPGPIAAPGKDALIAVAQPINSDYLYFLSGDDDVTYFGRTEADHQRNIENHCQKKCQIL